MSEPRIVRFGVFEIDLANAELRKHGLRVRLQEQPYLVLSALLERPGEVISRDELVRRLWPDGTFVDFDRGLNAAVTRLRQALSDSAENPKFVQTVARRGYRFLSPVENLNGSTGIHRPEILDAASGRKRRPLRRIGLYAAVGLLILIAVWLTSQRSQVPKSGLAYAQITDFTDSAIAPALSPDGRTLAFIRDNAWFLSRGQIWLKSLPDGEPVQLTRDPRQKFALTFSPDSSRVAYSVVDPHPNCLGHPFSAGARR